MSILISTIASFTDITASIFKKVSINKVKLLGIEFTLNNETESIDDRIQKIELAKKNLQDGLTAIDELQKEADKNRKDAENALNEIKRLKGDKSNLESEIESIRTVIKSDVTAFKKIAGVPSEKQIRKERVIGFVSGVFASVLASGLVWLIVFLVKLVFKME